MQKKVLWLFGLSGAGKTSIATAISKKISSQQFPHFILDGDELRETVNQDLGYSEEDRKENIRRAAEFAKLVVQQNMICISSFITPLKILRNLVKMTLNDNIILFFIDTPLEECIKRDVKGLYQKAQDQQISNFTGVSAKFEYPDENENVIRISTLNKTSATCADEILAYFFNQVENL